MVLADVLGVFQLLLNRDEAEKGIKRADSPSWRMRNGDAR
jgi:hypothetical protein